MLSRVGSALPFGAYMPNLNDAIVIHDKKLAARYRRKPMPVATLYEAYFDGAIDIKGDTLEFLRGRQGKVSYRLTRKHLSWAVTNFVPEVAIHSKAQDQTHRS